MIAYAFVGIAPFFLENIYLILLTRCGVGICESIVMTVTTTMLSDYYKGASRERWLAAQTATASLSALLIIWAGGQLGAKFGWHGPFLVYLYSLVLVIGIILFTWEPAKNSVLEIATASTDARYQEFPMARMLGICAITLVASVMFYSTITQNANALVSLGVTDPHTIGNLSSLASLGVPLGTFIFWGLARLHIGWLLFIDAALIGLGFNLMGNATTAESYAWAANVQQIGCGLVLPTMLVWATRGLAFHIRGRGTGMWQASFAIGQFVSGVTLTFLGKQLGGLLPTFAALGKFCFAAAALTVIATLIWGRSIPAVSARLRNV
jgi:MFS family permease